MALGWLWSRAWFPFAAVVAAALCVAGVVLGGIGLHFAWQVWYLATKGPCYLAYHFSRYFDRGCKTVGYCCNVFIFVGHQMEIATVSLGPVQVHGWTRFRLR